MTTPDLTPRATPQQSRSVATYEKILQASGALLEESGVDGFNTNLLALRAGVAISAVYRYFPNKWAILLALADRFRTLERAWIGDLRKLTAAEDWAAVINQAIDGYYSAARRQRGYVALRAASLASPELQRGDALANAELEADLAAGLRGLGLCMEDGPLGALSRVIIQSANRILDLALQSKPAEADLLVTELKRTILARLREELRA